MPMTSKIFVKVILEKSRLRDSDYTRIYDHRVKSTFRIHRIYPASLATRELNFLDYPTSPQRTWRRYSFYIYGKPRGRHWENFDLLKFLRAFCSAVDQGGRLATADSSLSEHLPRDLNYRFFTNEGFRLSIRN